MLELLLRQSRGSLGFLKLNLTQLTFDDFLRLPPLAYLVDFDCTNVDHVTDALWEKLTPSRTSLCSLAAIGLDNLEFQFARIAEFSNPSSLNLSNTCVSVNDVIVICQTLATSLTMLNVSECSRLNLLAILPGIRETRKLVHLSVHDLSVAEAVTADKESVLATFKDVFDCLSSLKFLDVGWIKDAGAVTGWDIACAILECRGSGLTHLDVSGLASLRETLRFVKNLGIERSLQYLGAFHTNLRYHREGNDDNRPSPFLRNDLVADVNDLKVVATGFQNVDAFVLCQSHYLAPTPRNDAILKLIADCLIAKDYYAMEEETGVLLSFFLRKCRAARRSKWDSSSPLRSILQLAKLAAYLCEKDPDLAYYDRDFNRVFYSICHELILIASSFSSVSSAVKLRNHLL